MLCGDSVLCVFVWYVYTYVFVCLFDTSGCIRVDMRRIEPGASVCVGAISLAWGDARPSVYD